MRDRPQPALNARALLLALLVAVAASALADAAPAIAAPPETPEVAVEHVFASTAVFAGTLSPKATEANEGGTYQFSYRASSKGECKGAGEKVAPASPGISLGAPQEKPPPEQITGLTPASEYALCLSETNLKAETATSPAVSFKTGKAAKPEAPETAEVSERKATTATLNGVLNPHEEGEPGKFRFLYRQSASECAGGSETAEEAAPSSSPLPVSAAISGLEAGKPYTFCVQAINSLGESTLSAPRTFTSAIPPETPEKLEANPIAATTATLNGVLNAKASGEAGTYEFLYAQSTEACEGAVITPAEHASGAQGEPAKAGIEGLLPHTAYTFCLRARNEVGEESALSAPVTFTTLAAAPTIEEAFVTGVSATSATLHATLNPQGAETSYQFEYAPSGGEFKPVSEPEGNGTLPEGLTGVPLEVHVQHGLEPSTAYEFRLTATNSVKSVTGELVSFTTQAGGEFVLPDGRQYEMVSPAQKQGALFLPLSEPPQLDAGQARMIQGSVLGDAVVSTATGPTEAEPQGYSNVDVPVLSTRGRSGWSSQVIAPPHLIAGPSGQGRPEYRYFSRDLSLGVLQPIGDFAKLSPLATESTAYLRADYFNHNVAEHCEAASSVSCYLPLVTAANDTAIPLQPFGEVSAAGDCVDAELRCGPRFQAGTPDLTHIVLSTPIQLTSTPVEPAPAVNANPPPNLYEWAAGKLQLLSLMPGAHEGSRSLILAGGPLSGGSEMGSRHSISSDGRYIVMAESETIKGPTTGLFLRDVAKGETIRLDVPQGGGAEASLEPEYMTASSNGARIFFLDAARLTPDSKAAEGKRPDLYECAVTEEPGTGKDKCTLSDLTPKAGGEPACVVMVLGASEDGSYVYFAAGGVLASAASGDPACRLGGETSEAEARDIYVRHEGETHLVARLSTEDYLDWVRGGSSLSEQGVRVSPNGRWMAFMSGRSLTGYDTRDAVGHPNQEVYLYDAAAGRLACASCDPTGARPQGELASAGRGFVAALVPGWTKVHEFGEGFYQPRYLSDGGRLFFDALGALVPKDGNGMWDVYQYEPAGVPTGGHACSASAASGSEVFKPARPFEVEGREREEGAGCVALISSGTSDQESTFLDASETGGDVFFLTNAKLSPQDTDTAPDVYDAHECTAASPCVSAPTQPRPCDTEGSCRGAPSPQPNVFGAPASGTFSGPGNVTASSTSPVEPLTNAQKLAKALKACRVKHNRKHRAACERQVTRRYGPKSKARRANNHRRASR